MEGKTVVSLSSTCATSRAHSRISGAATHTSRVHLQPFNRDACITSHCCRGHTSTAHVLCAFVEVAWALLVSGKRMFARPTARGHRHKNKRLYQSCCSCAKDAAANNSTTVGVFLPETDKLCLKKREKRTTCLSRVSHVAAPHRGDGHGPTFFLLKSREVDNR